MYVAKSLLIISAVLVSSGAMGENWCYVNKKIHGLKSIDVICMSDNTTTPKDAMLILNNAPKTKQTNWKVSCAGNCARTWLAYGYSIKGNNRAIEQCKKAKEVLGWRNSSCQSKFEEIDHGKDRYYDKYDRY